MTLENAGQKFRNLTSNEIRFSYTAVTITTKDSKYRSGLPRTGVEWSLAFNRDTNTVSGP